MHSYIRYSKKKNQKLGRVSWLRYTNAAKKLHLLIEEKGYTNNIRRFF